MVFFLEFVNLKAKPGTSIEAVPISPLSRSTHWMSAVIALMFDLSIPVGK